MMGDVHYLKTWSTPFQATFDGLKSYELREFDRDFKIGDLVVLDEYLPREKKYTGRRIIRIITYLNAPGQWGLRGEIGVLGTREVSDWLQSGVKYKTHAELAQVL